MKKEITFKEIENGQVIQRNEPKGFRKKFKVQSFDKRVKTIKDDENMAYKSAKKADELIKKRIDIIKNYEK